MQQRIVGYLAFALLFLMCIVLGLGTWDEHINGSDHAYAHYYSSLWFTLGWIATATTALYYLWCYGLQKRIAVFSLHIAFILILLGALCTKLYGKTGMLYLREGEPQTMYMCQETNLPEPLPFSVTLREFQVEYYGATHTPADYKSHIEITDADGNTITHSVSMNNILNYKGIRLYQSSYDEDLKGSFLSVNDDAWGTGISYVGYFLLFFSFIALLCSRKERFRQLFKKISNEKLLLLLIVIGLGTTNTATAQLIRPDSLSINQSEAQYLSQLCVEYQGRICPINTLSIDFCKKLLGQTSYKDMTAEQIFWGCFLFPERWHKEPILPLKSKELRLLTSQINTAAIADLYTSDQQYKLYPYYQQMYQAQVGGWLKEARHMDERIMLFASLNSGDLLKIFSLPTENGIKWLSTISEQSTDSTNLNTVFVKFFRTIYRQAVLNNQPDAAHTCIDKLITMQQAASDYPSSFRQQTEKFYNRAEFFKYLFMFALTIGFILLFGFIYSAIRKRSTQSIERIAYYLLIPMFVIASLGIALRTYIGERFPLSNGYETMVLLAWIALGLGLLCRRLGLLCMVFSYLIAGFTLLVAHLSSMNPHITPLVPVLQSPLLSVHVLSIMLAYGLVGFMALSSLSALGMALFSKNNEVKTKFIERMKDINELLMYPAMALLGSGIFIGAIWANVSWGRYWGWDPKEIWALICFLLMGLSVHRSLRFMQRPIFYHTFIIIIFLTVLMTYFGVNYLLGGRHSYANA